MDGEVASRARLYLAIFPLFWLNIIIRRGMRLASDGQLANWKVNGLPGNERLRRYLARALSWPEMDYRRTLEDLRAVEFFPVRAMERNG
jgi:hypothetical protein